MTRNKQIACILLSLVLLFFVSTACSLNSVRKDSGPNASAMPAISTIPNVAAPGAKINCYGANFAPGGKLKVVMMTFPEVETILGEEAAGLALKTDEMGSFELPTTVPDKEGVYPIRVYNSDDDALLATTLVVVAEKK